MSISIGSDSIYAMTTENAKSSAKAASVETKLTGISSDASDEELLEACKTFESYLVEQVISSMEKTIPKDEEDEGDYESYFKDMLYKEYAQKITDNGELGLAQQLYESMKRNQGM